VGKDGDADGRWSRAGGFESSTDIVGFLVSYDKIDLSRAALFTILKQVLERNVAVVHTVAGVVGRLSNVLLTSSPTGILSTSPNARHMRPSSSHHAVL